MMTVSLLHHAPCIPQRRQRVTRLEWSSVLTRRTTYETQRVAPDGDRAGVDTGSRHDVSRARADWRDPVFWWSSWNHPAAPPQSAGTARQSGAAETAVGARAAPVRSGDWPSIARPRAHRRGHARRAPGAATDRGPEPERATAGVPARWGEPRARRGAVTRRGRRATAEPHWPSQRRGGPNSAKRDHIGAPAIAAGGAVSRLRGLLRDRHGRLSSLWQ